ncbi:MAG TPA: non-homologous end-joining DNA ligase [Candidatus Limnocylindria bacterium]|nr:non-homologous end-joining DNA ligase [Candidatus Limnocylindria bacterium]
MTLPPKPMLATLAKGVPAGPEWVFEEKYDGIRLIADRRKGRVRLFSRNLIDRTASWPDVAEAIASLPDGDLTVDGEVFAYDRMRVSRFQLLQQRGRPTFAVFDVLALDGRSVMRRPLSERRALCETLLEGARAPLMLSRRLSGGGAKALETARRKEWEGIIAKDERSPYEPGIRSRAWLKVKVRRESEFVIGGWTPPEGSRAQFGALLVGMFGGPRLRYVGKVGTGFTGLTLAALGAKLARLETARTPFDPPPRVKDAHWVRPRLVAQVAFAEWTADGKLRQPAFLGLRDDKRPEEVRWSERE